MNVGAFLIKCYELQQTIDKSMRDYKIFFRWLFIAIARLLNEAVPDDIGTITQQEINYLAEFLNNFEQNRQEIVDDAGEMEIKFNLERVGQYLADKNLVIPMKDEHGFWEEILTENECLKIHPMIFPHHKTMSLIQQKNLMKSSIEDVFGRLKNSIGRDFRVIDSENSRTSPIISTLTSPRSSHVCDVINDQNVNYFSILTSAESLQLIVCAENSPVKTFELKFISSEESVIPKIGKLSFTDVRFYNSKLISLLLKNQVELRSQSCFMQLAINRIIDDSLCGGSSIIDLYKFIDDTNFKSLEGFNGHAIAVSGSRKVSAILSTNFKIIRLYDMEVEDDDADEELDSSSFIE
jgi:anaphase-promoting complex subunit 4